MKKKQYVILLAVVLILALAFCGYKYYTYYYQDVVTDYYGIEYTPPVERGVSLFGNVEYSQPQVKFKKLPKYLSDSSAISHKTAEVLSDRKFYVEEYKKEMGVVPKTDIEKVNQGASLQALKELLKKQYFPLVSPITENTIPKTSFGSSRRMASIGIRWNSSVKSMDLMLSATLYTENGGYPSPLG